MTLGISFIVPTFNEEEYISRCLTSIQQQMEISEIPTELIVVDNNSTDNTAEIARKYTSHVFFNTTPGSPSITRNLGASHAHYTILCFIDGDCIISEHWISRLISTFANKQIGAYGGPILSPIQGNWVETAWAPTQSCEFIKENALLAGANFAIRKDLFESLGGFNENLISAEDDDLSKRVIASGQNICYDSKQSLIHLGYPKSLAGIFKKQIWHGSSQIRAHGLRGDKVVILTILFFVALLVSLVNTLLFHNKILWSFTLLVFSIPAVLVYGRSRKFASKSMLLYIKMYLISFAFLGGRTLGLVKELLGMGLKNR